MIRKYSFSIWYNYLEMSRINCTDYIKAYLITTSSDISWNTDHGKTVEFKLFTFSIFCISIYRWVSCHSIEIKELF